MSNAVKIRDAKPSDVPELQKFFQLFVADKRILPRTDDDVAVLIMHGFVAEADDEIAGFAAIEIYSKKLAEIQALAVSTKLQGQGVGSELVRRCVERAKEEGVLELMAITATENLFRSAGFDYSLPNQKRALFMQIREQEDQE